jgi:Na+-transporting methylmalonyl-CoA/oxaloacetate decarboxylase gamma subunit
VLVIQGVIFVATVLLFRRGIVGEMSALANRRWAAKRRQDEVAIRKVRPAE